MGAKKLDFWPRTNIPSRKIYFHIPKRNVSLSKIGCKFRKWSGSKLSLEKKVLTKKFDLIVFFTFMKMLSNVSFISIVIKKVFLSVIIATILKFQKIQPGPHQNSRYGIYAILISSKWQIGCVDMLVFLSQPTELP